MIFYHKIRAKTHNIYLVYGLNNKLAVYNNSNTLDLKL